MSRGFHSENELYSMQNSFIVGHFDHWNHIPYDLQLSSICGETEDQGKEQG